MEDRTVPSELVYSGQYGWATSGSPAMATVTVTVTEDAGEYLWNYHLQNHYYGTGGGLGQFAIEVDDPDLVSGEGSSVGWAGSDGSWLAGPGDPLVGPGQSADFWFTTLPTVVIATTGSADALGGPAVAPALVVTTLSDVVDRSDDATTLSPREAIDNLKGLPGAHTIPFAQAIQGGTITLDPDPSMGALTVSPTVDAPNPDITIGESSYRMTIQRDRNAEQLHRLFTAGADTTLNLVNLDLRWGSVNTGGGAVYSIGTQLSIQNCYFEGNEASNGGAISFSGHQLDITGSTFVANVATLDGGAISIEGGAENVSITNSTISANSADRGGGINIRGSNTQTPTSAILDGVVVSDNRATTQGGGIWAGANGSGTDLTLRNDTWIHHNSVINPNPTYDTKGGGIYFGKGTITATSVTIGFNDAKTGDGMYRLMGTTLVGLPTYEGGDQGIVEP